MKLFSRIIFAFVTFSALHYTETAYATSTPPQLPVITMSAAPSSIAFGAQTSLNWSVKYADSCAAWGGNFTGVVPTTGTFETPPLTSTSFYGLYCYNSQGGTGGSLTVTVAPQPPAAAYQSVSLNSSTSTATAAAKLGMNLGAISDWGDQSISFVDLMKQARGFASIANYWDPGNYPVPVDTNGWPTTDFGIVFTSTVGDPLNRSLTTTYPSMFGTYTLSFTGKATLSPCGTGVTVMNQVYTASTNTTTANVVVGPAANQITLLFTNTVNGAHKGVQNLKLLRPGYALGTTQLFTNAFLTALNPYSTLRFMDFLQTNGNPVTSWAERKQATDPTQNDTRGVAWEYVIALANATNKDIWINIPVGVNLNDTSSNNYITQLATLLKANLNPNIHVYVEYSNELWNYGFSQATINLEAAINDLSSGIDTTLNYDFINNTWYWAEYRNAHQTIKISQLFSKVYGAAAINTTIRPLLLGQFGNPFATELMLNYIQTNFGAPSNYIYGIGGAPYFDSGSTDTTLNGLFSGLLASLKSTMAQFVAPTFNGGNSTYTGITFQGMAKYYHLKSVAYEGGPAINTENAVLQEQALQDTRLNQYIQAEVNAFILCGNDLFVYFDLAGPTGDSWGATHDIAVPTESTNALATVSATPQANLVPTANECTTANPPTYPGGYITTQ
jgi:hypothetical protein